MNEKSKGVSSYWLAISVAISVVLAFLLVREKNKGSSSFADNESIKKIIGTRQKSLDEIASGAEQWFDVLDKSDQFADKLKKRADVKVSVGAGPAAAPPIKIAPEIGNIYMGSYIKNLKGTIRKDNTYSFKVPEDELSFLITQVHSTTDTIQFSLGIYDKDSLDRRILSDQEMVSRGVTKVQNKFALVVGIWPSANPARTVKKYVEPFKVGGYEFYDDWHDTFP